VRLLDGLLEIRNYQCKVVPEKHIWENAKQVIYGPVCSRRFRYSLGINLFPRMKICNYDCPYCDMGRTPIGLMTQLNKKLFIENEAILSEIRESLIIHKQRATLIDIITICGNGEATIHPQFSQIVEGVLRLRDRIFPQKPLAILTNSSLLPDPRIKKTLTLLDEIIFKLDAGDEKTFALINRPIILKYNFDEIIDCLVKFPKSKISTAVVKGNGYSNIKSLKTTFVKLIKQISPREIHLHNIDYPIINNDNSVTRLTLQEMIEIGREIAEKTQIKVCILHLYQNLRRKENEREIR